MDLFFSSLSVKRFSYLILVVFIAWLANSLIHHAQSHWLVWTSFLLSLITTGDSFRRRLIAIVATGLLAGLVSFISAALITSPFFLTFYLFLITMVCVVIGQRYPVIFLQACMINLFAILAGSMNITLGDDMYRFEFICAGMLIAAVLQMIFYPYFIRNEMQSYLVITLRNLTRLNQEIFSCFLDPAYDSNIYLYERRLHIRKEAFLHAMSRLREMIRLAETKLSEVEKASHDWWLDKLDALFGNMMDYAQLRRRVTDFSTFSICSRELSGIAVESEQCLNAVIVHVRHKKCFINVEQLNRNIDQLENNYHQVLQVASREPFAFLLFISSLNALSKKLQELCSHVMPVSSHLS